MALGWRDTSTIGKRGWVCGYCGKDVGGDTGFFRTEKNDPQHIYICPKCEKPTAFVYDEHGVIAQIPGEPYGNDVESLPDSVAALYAEVRRCIQYTSYTAAVLAMRKLLMHVAVDCGADENLPFVKYVDYLDENHYITPNAKEWADTLRTYGNDATHQIVIMDEVDAKQLLDFAEMMLKIVYEFPNKQRRR